MLEVVAHELVNQKFFFFFFMFVCVMRVWAFQYMILN